MLRYGQHGTLSYPGSGPAKRRYTAGEEEMLARYADDANYDKLRGIYEHS